MSEQKVLAQDFDVMFERNVAIKASKEEQVQIYTIDSGAYVGFICGLDEKWMQICGRNCDFDDGNEWDLILLNIKNIASINSTEYTLKDVDIQDRDQVQKRIQNFVTVSRSFIEKKK
jgi:hypothetical protein